jgi:hypothetical protein
VECWYYLPCQRLRSSQRIKLYLQSSAFWPRTTSWLLGSFVKHRTHGSNGRCINGNRSNRSNRYRNNGSNRTYWSNRYRNDRSNRTYWSNRYRNDRSNRTYWHRNNGSNRTYWSRANWSNRPGINGDWPYWSNWTYGLRNDRSDRPHRTNWRWLKYNADLYRDFG